MPSKKIASSLVALAVASFCGLAQADNVTFTGFSNGSETVTATLSGPNAAVSKSVSAGGFSTIYNGSASFESYCVDLYQTISFGVLYPEYTVAAPLGHAFTNTNAYADLGRLYATAGATINSVTEAAFQIAVWEIAYEATGTGYNLASGAATFSGGTAASSGALTMAAGWLASLSGTTPIDVLESTLHQDVIAGPHPGVTLNVPEPSVVLLMAAGLAAGAFARRKAKAKA